MKQEAFKVNSRIPESAEIDDIMYGLYVVDKVRKGRKAVREGRTVAMDELKREVESR